jgi:hypothetical protein
MNPRDRWVQEICNQFIDEDLRAFGHELTQPAEWTFVHTDTGWICELRCERCATKFAFQRVRLTNQFRIAWERTDLESTVWSDICEVQSGSKRMQQLERQYAEFALRHGQ